MVREWERQYPGRSDNMLRAMGHITLSHMMDRNHYPFTTIQPGGQPDTAGDKAFDDDDSACASPAQPGEAQPVQVVNWLRPSS